MIDAELIEAVKAKVLAEGADETTVAGLRKSWPGVHFTYCMDDDIGALEPYQKADGFNLYLVTGRDHCVNFTSGLENATGLVIACLDEDDG